MNHNTLLTLLAILPCLLALPFAEPLHVLPLRKAPTLRDAEHPMMAFQRHQNSAIKRLHHMSDPKLEKRLWFPPSPPAFTIEHQAVSKRLWFPPSSAAASDTHGGPEKRLWFRPSQPGEDGTSPRVLQAVGEAQAGVPPAPTSAGGGTRSAGSGTGAPQATITITASGSNAAGFSRAAAQALVSDSLLPSSADLIEGGLDYIIEGNDIGYLATIQLGTPPRDFLMIMDTGSADTWVPSTACTREQCGDHRRLGPEISSTFRGTTRAFEVTYGSGNVAGTVAADTMIIANMTLPAHVFGVTTVESVQFSAARVPFDGLVGLAFSSLSEDQAQTPIEALAASGLVRSAIMGTALGRAADGENVGELVFGQANPGKFDPRTTQTLPVTSQIGFWQAAMPAVRVNGRIIAGNQQAILDTGTLLMIAPPAQAAAFHAAIPGSADAGNGMFTIPCTTEAMVTMQFGAAEFQIDVRDLLFQPISNDLAGDCLSSLSAGTILDDHTWLLGDSFLKNVYMTTDVSARTIQLSARTDTPGSSSAGVSVANAMEGGGANTTTNIANTTTAAVTSGTPTRAGPTPCVSKTTISTLMAGVTIVATLW